MRAAAGAAPMLLRAPRLCASRAAAAAQSEGDSERLGGDMDESSLLDLLECSVCLERLDTTAKVLPCQHTFCRRCLESIVCSRHELRCPECRILVGCGVDELPANILLVRLLDGIRQRPRTGASPGSSPPARPGPSAGPGSGTASALAGVGGSAPGSPVLLPAATSATASLRDLATSRSAPLAKVGVCLAKVGAGSGEEGQETRGAPRWPSPGACFFSCFPPGSFYRLSFWVFLLSTLQELFTFLNHYFHFGNVLSINVSKKLKFSTIMFFI